MGGLYGSDPMDFQRSILEQGCGRSLGLKAKQSPLDALLKRTEEICALAARVEVQARERVHRIVGYSDDPKPSLASDCEKLPESFCTNATGNVEKAKQSLVEIGRLLDEL